MTWTTDTIIALAPDASSASSGKGLANKSKWLNIGKSGDALWGECQGSGKHPYQARLDMSEPAFKCSCPSRKFPCKHGLGLFLLFAAKPADFAETTPPSWVTEWLEGRQNRAEKKAEKATEAATKPPDPKAQEKRQAARDKKVRAGLEELQLWMSDLIRTGIAGVQSKGYGHWETMAARLIDAQAPGLARVIREIPGVLTRDDWQARLLAQLGAVHLAASAYKRLETLPEAVQADVRTIIGFPISSEEVLAQNGVQDTWQVIGQSLEQEDRLRARRTWLRGSSSGRNALILDFGVPQAPLGIGLPVGAQLEAELCFYPSQHPQRALIKGEMKTMDAIEKLEGQGIQTLLEQYAQALANNPWLDRVIFDLEQATLLSDGLMIRDSSGAALPIDSRFALQWPWLAVTGGHPATICGEWNGEVFMPLSATLGGKFHHFAFDGVNS
jgi:SWIM zinc finger